MQIRKYRKKTKKNIWNNRYSKKIIRKDWNNKKKWNKNLEQIEWEITSEKAKIMLDRIKNNLEEFEKKELNAKSEAEVEILKKKEKNLWKEKKI